MHKNKPWNEGENKKPAAKNLNPKPVVKITNIVQLVFIPLLFPRSHFFPQMKWQKNYTTLYALLFHPTLFVVIVLIHDSLIHRAALNFFLLGNALLTLHKRWRHQHLGHIVHILKIGMKNKSSNRLVLFTKYLGAG